MLLEELQRVFDLTELCLLLTQCCEVGAPPCRELGAKEGGAQQLEPQQRPSSALSFLYSASSSVQIEK